MRETRSSWDIPRSSTTPKSPTSPHARRRTRALRDPASKGAAAANAHARPARSTRKKAPITAAARAVIAGRASKDAAAASTHAQPARLARRATAAAQPMAMAVAIPAGMNHSATPLRSMSVSLQHIGKLPGLKSGMQSCAGATGPCALCPHKRSLLERVTCATLQVLRCQHPQ